MKRILGVSPTSLMLRVALYDSSSTTGGILTGLVFNTAGLAIAIAKDASAGADVLTNEDITTIGTYQAPTSSAHVRFKAVDATDMTGVYELHFHNDTVASIAGFILKISGATNLAPCFLEVQLSNLAANVTQISGSAVSTTTAQLGVNVVQMSGSASAADNIELAGVNYSATRGLSGTALPAAAAAAAGGIPVSTAGGLNLDAKLAATNEVTAARMGALTDWINGGRLDLILDAILEDTAVIGVAGAGLTDIPWNATWDAEVESEVDDSLDKAFTDATSLTSNGLKERLRTLAWILRNKLEVTDANGNTVVYKDDSVTTGFSVLAALTDNSTTTTRKRIA